jgi:hypothetical protein
MLVPFGLAALLALPGTVRAVQVHDLKGLEDIFGRYAPAGDCQRQPRIVVDESGLAFDVAGKTTKVTDPEYAASYGPHDYAGITKWIFPFRTSGGFPILMAFHDGEKPGALAITAQDEGWKGGPPLSPLNAALVKGSPYARCK